MNIKKLWLRFLALFPTKLPVGLDEFEVWSDSIISLYNAPNNDSVKFSLAVMILHLPATTAYKAKEFFGRSLVKAASNQVVSQVIQDLKAKQEAQRLAESSAKPVEAVTVESEK